MKKWILLLVVSVLIMMLAGEVYYRVKGYNAGYCYIGMKKVDSIICTPQHYADTFGVWKNVVSNAAPNVNKEGFTCPYDFDNDLDSLRKTGQKIIMLVGDSYVEGSGGGNVNESFARLIDADPRYAVMSLGVGGGDPLQYELVVKHYLERIKPDILVVCFFLGNDIMYRERKAEPYKPILFETNAGYLIVEPSIFTGQPPYGRFMDEKESYHYLLDIASLKSDNIGIFKRILGYSALGTFVYFKLHPPYEDPLKKGLQPVSHIHLERIKQFCEDHHTAYQLIAIPGIQDRKQDISKKYNYVFHELPVNYLDAMQFNESDYHSVVNDHFTATGNKKCAEQIIRMLDTRFKTQDTR